MIVKDELLSDWCARALRVEEAVGGVLLGLGAAIRLVNIAIFARGHVLLEGDVGVGKTLLLRAFARAIGGAFSRIEGTVALMPADLLYYTYSGGDGSPRVGPGPLGRGGKLRSILFFSEINRARPRVHSVLLR